jgi:hypothetical protein
VIYEAEVQRARHVLGSAYAIRGEWRVCGGLGQLA